MPALTKEQEEAFDAFHRQLKKLQVICPAEISSSIHTLLTNIASATDGLTLQYNRVNSIVVSGDGDSELTHEERVAMNLAMGMMVADSYCIASLAILIACTLHDSYGLPLEFPVPGERLSPHEE